MTGVRRIHRKLSPPRVPLVRIYEVELGPRRVLRRGTEASIRLPGRAHRKRGRFVFADGAGNLVFDVPGAGGLRTVRPDAVSTIHVDRKLRSTKEARDGNDPG